MVHPDYISSGLEIVESYEKRLKIIMDLINEAAGFVDEYTSEQDSMLMSLRQILAKKENLRKKDFDTHIECILRHREEMRAELKETFGVLWKEEGEIVKRLKDIFIKGAPKDFESIKNEYIPHMREREGAVARFIMRLQIDQAELSAELNELLSKGENLRLKDFRKAIKEFKFLQHGESNRAAKIVENFEKIRMDIMGQWHNLCSVYEKSAV
ncbi:MAG: hypothetical protein HYS21_02810 [Deltaproteobacteria bacterium]|nr:hypothetical protein [Deltaproteobacteria bacterium]